MAETSNARVWTMRVAYLALGLAIIFWHLLPLNTVPQRWAPPDLLIAFTFAWVLRRPDFVPVASVAAVMLSADLLFQRPPGLMAALVLMACEYLGNRVGGRGKVSFALEWLAVSAMIAAVAVANRVILSVLGVAVAPLGLTVIQIVMTMLVYPLVVLISGWLMGVRKLTPVQADRMGGRA